MNFQTGSSNVTDLCFESKNNKITTRFSAPRFLSAWKFAYYMVHIIHNAMIKMQYINVFLKKVGKKFNTVLHTIDFSLFYHVQLKIIQAKC